MTIGKSFSDIDLPGPAAADDDDDWPSGQDDDESEEEGEQDQGAKPLDPDDYVDQSTEPVTGKYGSSRSVSFFTTA